MNDKYTSLDSNFKINGIKFQIKDYLIALSNIIIRILSLSLNNIKKL